MPVVKPVVSDKPAVADKPVVVERPVVKPKVVAAERLHVPEPVPASFSASITLTYSSKTTISTVTGLLSKLLDVEISLPADADLDVAKLTAVEDKSPDGKGKGKYKKAPQPARAVQTYTGTAKELLDKISIATGMLWEFQEKTVFFHE